jgi:hypothetical protein
MSPSVTVHQKREEKKKKKERRRRKKRKKRIANTIHVFFTISSCR